MVLCNTPTKIKAVQKLKQRERERERETNPLPAKIKASSSLHDIIKLCGTSIDSMAYVKEGAATLVRADRRRTNFHHASVTKCENMIKFWFFYINKTSPMKRFPIVGYLVLYPPVVGCNDLTNRLQIPMCQLKI